MSQLVDISGLPKASVLAALFNASAPANTGILLAAIGPSVMTEQDAEAIIRHGSPDLGFPRPELSFDYVYGRPLKIYISGDEMDPSGFDRDNGGEGTAQAIIDRLRVTKAVSGDDNDM